MAYVVKINNIDRTNLVRARTLSIKLDADYRDVCNLMVMTSVSGFLPRVGMPLTVTDGVDPVFSGLVSSAPMTKISALNGQDTLMAVRVEAVGFYKVAARRVVGAKYADVTAGSIVVDIHGEILADEGVTIGYIGAGADIGELDLTTQTAESALDQLARASGYKWYITHDKKLYFQETGTVTDAAHDLDETGVFKDFRNVSKQEDLDQYRNRQIIIGQETEDGRIEYTKEKPAEISARQAVEGGSGVYEHIISDDTIATVQAAEDLATSLLDLYGTVPIEITFDSYTVDWRPGTRLKVHMPSMGILAARYFLIEQVDLRDLGGTLLGAVIRASSRDAMNFSTQMKEDYVAFFRQLLNSEKKAIARANEINKLSTGKMEEMLLKFNEQLAGAMGYYSTTVTQPGGAKITYQHDQPALEDSTYISYVPAPGTFAWTTTGWNNGSPVWEYGVTQDGNAVFRLLSTVGINADWINAGSIDTNVIYVGDETLTTALANMQTQISELASGSGNFIRNSNFGTYENPYDTFWGEGLTWDLLESRNMDWDTLEIEVADWDEFESGDF